MKILSKMDGCMKDSKVIVYLLFIGFMFVGSFGSIFLYYNFSQDILKEQTIEYFDAIAHSRADHIAGFLDDKKNNLVRLSRDHHFQDLLLGLTEREVLYSESKIDHYREILEYIIEGDDEVFILNNDGIVVSSSIKENIGLNKSEDAYFLSGREGAYIKNAYFSEATGRNSIAFSAPIIHYGSKEVLGVIVSRFDLSLLGDISSERTGLGDTGEVYLLNKDRIMLTESRFEGGAVLNKFVDSEGARKCFEDSSEAERGFGIYDNYRGTRVFGVEASIPEMEWCLLAEISEREAVGLTNENLLSAGLLIVFGLLILMIVFILVANRILLKNAI